MKTVKSRMFLMFFLITFIAVPLYNSKIISPTEENSQNSTNIPQIQAVNRTGKIFSNITRINKNCYVNREQPSLDNQPSIYIPNYNISRATMSFENITAINYTRYIEDDFTEFIASSFRGPTYIYQKFAVELSQYVNNVSILVQDINNPLSFTDENAWEVAIVNCSNDIYGTPNTFDTLGVMQKPHPLVYAAHWEVFDFKNSGSGPIFLDITKTNSTNENDSDKYWFAFRIKIPQDDELTGGGPKFLYFNPDGDDPQDIGEGATFAISPDFFFDDYTLNNVRASTVPNGTLLQGDLNSFRDIDENRYIAEDANNVTIDVEFNLDELKNSPFTYWELLWNHKFLEWWIEHYKYIFSFDITLIVNVSNSQNIQSGNLSMYNFKAGPMTDPWVNLEYDLIKDNETTIFYSVTNPWEKIGILSVM
ncbi:MAG: hypothetical protein ACXADU_19140, partial [Promethearchaeota archaeon]